ncbi:MAG: outer membrane protein assembly factor BamE [Pseudomonadales bacterium]
MTPHYLGTPRFIITLLLAGALVSGCSFPRLYRATVQQGNVITQEMVDKLTPGMTRSQVAFIMGEPVLRNTFASDRWDYIYTVTLPGYYEEEKRLTLYFEDDVLSFFTGDYLPASASPDSAAR